MIDLDYLKGLARSARDGGAKSLAGYLRAGRVIQYHRQLTWTDHDLARELHVLGGHSRLIMALWMILSLFLACQRSCRVVFHDDGSLTLSDMELLQALLPDCNVVMSSVADVTIERGFREYPLCLACRNLHPICRKLFDLPFFATSDRILSVDTDVLFFRRPSTLLDAWQSRQDNFLFMTDVADASLLTADEVFQKFGTVLPLRVNAGIALSDARFFSWDFLEFVLSRTTLLSCEPWFIEQTLYAILASVHGGATLLPDEYCLTLDDSCSGSAVARHYVGAVRHQFYSEGISRVSSLAKAALIAGR